MNSQAPHTFHIPVMGLAFTIDTPIKVARYGINSVISIIQDNLVEKMREYYYGSLGETYTPISSKEKDSRSRRITDYLNLVNRIVKEQVEQLKQTPFGKGTEINKYFEMLPDSSELKRRFKKMLKLPFSREKSEAEDWLRSRITPGSIDVNIMTKLDQDSLDKNGKIIQDGSYAVRALKGYADSDLTQSTIILSAGMNPRLFNYMSSLSAFDSNEIGVFKKKIALKVSDYRSALIQGRMLAKKGLWVSEFRVESGLNCGGHAFATDGYLLGPILEEFKNQRQELSESLYEVYREALLTSNKKVPKQKPHVAITVQGGIGSSDENSFLHEYYQVDGTGWGTPFLLVPEATTVDNFTLSKLSRAKEQDVLLSKKSPLGVPFYYLQGTSADKERMKRIKEGRPGSPCTEKFLQFNSEFGEGLSCVASSNYQDKKLKELKKSGLSKEEFEKAKESVVDKDCLCIGLSNSAISQYKLTPFKNLESINVCPGPNIAYFNKIVSLKNMIDHIYGRRDLLGRKDRPNMFIKELMIYVEYWKGLINDTQLMTNKKQAGRVRKFYDNLQEGIDYYRGIIDRVAGEIDSLKKDMEQALQEAEIQLIQSFNQLELSK